MHTYIIVWVHWEHLGEYSVREIFNSYLGQSFFIMREASSKLHLIFIYYLHHETGRRHWVQMGHVLCLHCWGSCTELWLSSWRRRPFKVGWLVGVWRQLMGSQYEGFSFCFVYLPFILWVSVCSMLSSCTLCSLFWGPKYDHPSYLAWEEFGDAMENFFQSASKRFWQTIKWLNWGYSWGAEGIIWGTPESFSHAFCRGGRAIGLRGGEKSCP